ncbi:3'-5' exonuclease [Gloeocapsa sp. PCC 73106]|uniref:3'-5' exonuclease n=1 Tax=Gloeocapsa sp. PCC 73106 TaxID=102232 RepID=UPI00031AADF8|nr:3'-5' exonuclease [Gloeocapsa sp. PCC 73106]
MSFSPKIKLKQDFLIIDTEGKPELSQIAIVNRDGRVIYEAYCQPNSKELSEIVNDLTELLFNKLLVFHYAEHDIQVLYNSFKRVGKSLPKLQTTCTCQLARQNFSGLISYSLQYLSQYFDLRVKGRVFNPNLAHSAKYDAQFTYQLYQKLMKAKLQDSPNPFSSNRVDTPFQNHPDLREIYQSEFLTLKSILLDIKKDHNHQTKGVIVIGQPGSGKTHLMMRLTQEILVNNRLLFIRQPNNAESVLFHIYTRILESLVEPVGDSDYSQIEYFLAKTFLSFLRSEKQRLSKSMLGLLEKLESNHFALFEFLGQDNTKTKREKWRLIEKLLCDWWTNQYAGSGYSLNIIRGIVKYCSYTDKNYKLLVTSWLAAKELPETDLARLGLEQWSEDLSREAFALEAIAVFGKLSLLDEPLIIIFDQLESLSMEHNRSILLSFGEAIKEIFTHVPNSLIIFNLFPDRWEYFQDFFDPSVIDRISQYVIKLNHPSEKQLQRILALKLNNLDISLEDIFTQDDLQDILNQSSIRATINRAAAYYRYKVNGVELPPVYQTQTEFKPVKNTEQRLRYLEEELKQIKLYFKQLEDTQSFSLVTTNLSPVESADPLEQVLLNYLETEKNFLEKDYNLPKIIDDSDDIGKLREIATAFLKVQSAQIEVLSMKKLALPEHLVISKRNIANVLAFLHRDSSSFTARIKNFNQLVVNHPHLQFILMRDARQSALTGKVAREEIDKLNNATNGQFVLLEKEQRIELELIYKMITDINNLDLEIELEQAMNIWIKYYGNSWLTQKLSF